ncbi:unnamed protein product [Lactuca saligna]|uniref:Transmembrane protein n=1 Tax=Lactuca saligna TaxID=75948 RepID=A0AA36A109_LACSI|nr:unnamed protein product [Lactuca saligna]
MEVVGGEWCWGMEIVAGGEIKKDFGCVLKRMVESNDGGRRMVVVDGDDGRQMVVVNVVGSRWILMVNDGGICWEFLRGWHLFSSALSLFCKWSFQLIIITLSRRHPIGIMENYMNWVQGMASAAALLLLIGFLCCCLIAKPRPHGDLRTSTGACSCDGFV